MQATAEEDKSRLLALHSRRVSCALGNAGALLLCQVSQPFAGVGFKGWCLSPKLRASYVARRRL
jgi:hypothetical protein